MVSPDPVEAVLNACQHTKYPILHFPSFGHKPLENPIIPIGVMVNLDSDQRTICAIEPYVV